MLVHRDDQFSLKKKLTPESQTFAHLSSSDLLEQIDLQPRIMNHRRNASRKGDWSIDASVVTCSASLVRSIKPPSQIGILCYLSRNIISYRRTDDFRVCTLMVNENMRYKDFTNFTEPIFFKSEMSIALDSSAPVIKADHLLVDKWLTLPTFTINVFLSLPAFSLISSSSLSPSPCQHHYTQRQP
jgi:hypothetical protein